MASLPTGRGKPKPGPDPDPDPKPKPKPTVSLSLTPHQVGITDGFVRISCGIEDADDLIASLKQSLDAL